MNEIIPNPEESQESKQSRMQYLLKKFSNKRIYIAMSIFLIAFCGFFFYKNYMIQDDKIDVDTLIRILNSNPSISKRNNAIRKYEKLIAYDTTVSTHYENMIHNLDIKLSLENDIKAKSNLFFIKGLTEYFIGSNLYYKNIRGNTNLVIELYSESSDSFDNSIKLYNNAIAHAYKGIILLDIGLNKEFAISELEKSIELDHTDPYVYYKLGNGYKSIGNPDKAISMYISGLAIDEKSELILLNLGLIYFEKGERKKGYETYNKGISICKEFCNTLYHNISTEYRTDKLLDKALEASEKAIKFAQEKGEVYRNAYFTHGEILYDMGKKKEAIEALEKSFNNPNDLQVENNMFNQNSVEADSYYLIAKIYYELGERALSEKYLAEGKIKYPNNTDIKYAHFN